MKKCTFKAILILLLSISTIACEKTTQDTEVNYVLENYDKTETIITTRDGVKLFTTIYSPKDKSTTYPILMQRTPYSVRPYGADKFRKNIAPNKHLMEEGNIVVYQDVRGRGRSECT